MLEADAFELVRKGYWGMRFDELEFAAAAAACRTAPTSPARASSDSGVRESKAASRDSPGRPAALARAAAAATLESWAPPLPSVMDLLPPPPPGWVVRAAPDCLKAL